MPGPDHACRGYAAVDGAGRTPCQAASLLFVLSQDRRIPLGPALNQWSVVPAPFGKAARVSLDTHT